MTTKERATTNAGARAAATADPFGDDNKNGNGNSGTGDDSGLEPALGAGYAGGVYAVGGA